jgi:hypothetical protein
MQTRSQTRKQNLHIDTNVNKSEKSEEMNISNRSSEFLDIDNLYVLHPPILPIYEVNLNFDESINTWRENKQQTGPGHYKYICVCKTKSGTPCKNKPLIGHNTCVVHTNNK